MIHRVAARGFSAGRAAVGRQADKVAGRAAKRVAKETREAKKVDLKPVKNAYKLAKEGKIHKKLYSENVNRPDKQLRKAIRSLQKGIDEHQDKIANPGNYYLDWDTFTKDRQQRQLIKWRREIKGFTEQKLIYEGILKNRKS